MFSQLLNTKPSMPLNDGLSLMVSGENNQILFAGLNNGIFNKLNESNLLFFDGNLEWNYLDPGFPFSQSDFGGDFDVNLIKSFKDKYFVQHRDNNVLQFLINSNGNITSIGGQGTDIVYNDELKNGFIATSVFQFKDKFLMSTRESGVILIENNRLVKIPININGEEHFRVGEIVCSGEDCFANIWPSDNDVVPGLYKVEIEGLITSVNEDQGKIYKTEFYDLKGFKLETAPVNKRYIEVNYFNNGYVEVNKLIQNRVY